MKRLFLLLAAVGILGAAFLAPGANAAVGIQKWESLTCKSNEDLPAITKPEDFGKPEIKYEKEMTEPAGQCKGENLESLFTQAAGLANANRQGLPSYPSRSPRRELDFILHSAEIEINRFEIPDVQFSDHLPLICDFTINERARRAA